MGTAGREAAGQRSAGVKAELFMVEGARAAARIDVRFQDGHPVACLAQESSGRQAADPRADDDGVRIFVNGWYGCQAVVGGGRCLLHGYLTLVT